MLLPTMLPTAMSRSPRMAARIEVANSGSEVPIAITVRPITSSDSPSARASATAPVHSTVEPTTSSTSPPITKAALIRLAYGLAGSFRPNSLVNSSLVVAAFSLRLLMIRNSV